MPATAIVPPEGAAGAGLEAVDGAGVGTPVAATAAVGGFFPVLA